MLAACKELERGLELAGAAADLSCSHHTMQACVVQHMAAVVGMVAAGRVAAEGMAVADRVAAAGMVAVDTAAAVDMVLNDWQLEVHPSILQCQGASLLLGRAPVVHCNRMAVVPGHQKDMERLADRLQAVDTAWDGQTSCLQGPNGQYAVIKGTMDHPLSECS